jgi:hypothetical protein
LKAGTLPTADDPEPVILVATRLFSVIMLVARLLSPDAGSGHPSTNGGAETFGFGVGHAPSADVALASRNRVPEIQPFISSAPSYARTRRCLFDDVIGRVYA